MFYFGLKSKQLIGNQYWVFERTTLFCLSAWIWILGLECCVKPFERIRLLIYQNLFRFLLTLRAIIPQCHDKHS